MKNIYRWRRSCFLLSLFLFLFLLFSCKEQREFKRELEVLTKERNELLQELRLLKQEAVSRKEKSKHFDIMQNSIDKYCDELLFESYKSEMMQYSIPICRDIY